jgi:amino acid transporter
LPRAGSPAYRRSLSALELVSLGVGGTIGSGIFVVPALAARLAGPLSLASWLAVGASACAVALALAELQRRSPAGTPFTDLFRPHFGALAAAAIVGLYLAGAVFGIATIAVGLTDYLAYFAAPAGALAGASAIAAFLALNLAGIALSGLAEDVLTIAKIAAILAIVALLAPHIEPGRLAPVGPVSAPALLQVVILVYWPFSGFEISAIPVAEARRPDRIPRALLAVMALVITLYFALNVALLGAVGSEALAVSSAPVADAMARWIPAAGPLVAAAAVVTMASALNAYVVAASRVLQNAAQSYRWRGLARLSPRGTPVAALVAVCAGASALLLASDRFDALATGAVLCTLVPYLALCWAALRSARSPAVRAVCLLGAATTSAILVLSLLWSGHFT